MTATRELEAVGQMLSPDQLAQRWAVTRGTIYKFLDDGLPSLKLGRARRIRLADAEAWIAARQDSGDAA